MFLWFLGLGSIDTRQKEKKRKKHILQYEARGRKAAIMLRCSSYFVPSTLAATAIAEMPFSEAASHPQDATINDTGLREAQTTPQPLHQRTRRGASQPFARSIHPTRLPTKKVPTTFSVRRKIFALKPLPVDQPRGLLPMASHSFPPFRLCPVCSFVCQTPNLASGQSAKPNPSGNCSFLQGKGTSPSTQHSTRRG